MAGNSDPQRRPVLYDLKNQRFLADPAIGSTYYPINLSPGGAYLTSADIGVTVQGYDVDLAAIAGLSSSADRFPYYTGAGTAALATITAAGRALLDDTSAAGMRSTLAVDAAFTVTTTATSKTLSNRERCSVTAAAQTMTLPSSPQPGWEVAITIAGSFTNTIIARNGANIMSLAEDLTVDRGEVTVNLYYVDAARGWRLL